MANINAGAKRAVRGCRVARLLPDDFRRHCRAARRERLLSWRSLLDAAAERLEEPPAVSEETVRAQLIPDSFWVHRGAAREEDLLAFRSLVDSFLGWLEAWLEESPTAEVATRIEVE